MRIYKVTARFDDGEDSWDINLGVFRHEGRAKRVKEEFERQYNAAIIDEPEEPHYDSLIWPSVSDFYRSDVYREYNILYEEYNNTQSFQGVNIETYTVNGER